MAQKPIKSVLPAQQSQPEKSREASPASRPPPLSVPARVINHFSVILYIYITFSLSQPHSRFLFRRIRSRESCAISVKCAKVAINMLRSDTSIRNALKRRSFRVAITFFSLLRFCCCSYTLAPKRRQRIRYGFIGQLDAGVSESARFLDFVTRAIN